MQGYSNIDEYIQVFPGNVRELLQTIRITIHEVVPEATEKISYGIPTFYLKGNLVHFAGYKNHIGFYPGSVAIDKFKNELSGYKTSKGTVQFPLDKPLPLNLIKDIVKMCIKSNLEKKK